MPPFFRTLKWLLFNQDRDFIENICLDKLYKFDVGLEVRVMKIIKNFS